jgi:hypothetical protein
MGARDIGHVRKQPVHLVVLVVVWGKSRAQPGRAASHHLAIPCATQPRYRQDEHTRAPWSGGSGSAAGGIMPKGRQPVPYGQIGGIES